VTSNPKNIQKTHRFFFGHFWYVPANKLSIQTQLGPAMCGLQMTILDPQKLGCGGKHDQKHYFPPHLTTTVTSISNQEALFPYQRILELGSLRQS
jgi:hypothetical protein